MRSRTGARPARARACFFFFFLFLGYRGGLFSGPQSLPIPRQVHMCFISRQACLLNCKFQRRCWPGDTLGPEVEADRRKQKTGTEGITSLCFLFFFLRLSPKKNSGFFFLFLDPLPHPPHPPFLRCSSLGTCVSLRPPFFPQNWFIPRPTQHPRAAAHANSFGLFFFFYVSVSLLSSSSLVFFFFFAATNPLSPTTPPPSSLCPLIPFVRAVLALFLFMFLRCDTASAGEKREEGKKRTHNSKHLGRRELCLKQWFPFASGQKCSLVFFFFFLSYSSSSPPHHVTHTHQTQTHSLRHTSPQPQHLPLKFMLAR